MKRRTDLLKASSQRWLVVGWLIATQLGMVAVLTLWLVVAGFSSLALEGGLSPAALAFVLVVIAYPLAALACAVLAWQAYRQQRDQRAALLSALPLVPPLLYLFAVNLIG